MACQCTYHIVEGIVRLTNFLGPKPVQAVRLSQLLNHMLEDCGVPQSYLIA